MEPTAKQIMEEVLRLQDRITDAMGATHEEVIAVRADVRGLQTVIRAEVERLENDAGLSERIHKRYMDLTWRQVAEWIGRRVVIFFITAVAGAAAAWAVMTGRLK